MSKNIGKFIRNQVFDWLSENSTDPLSVSVADRSNFWISPYIPTNLEQKQNLDRLADEFAKSKIEDTTVFDDYRFGTIVADEGLYTVVGCLSGSGANPIRGLDETYEEQTLSFLLRLEFLSSLKIPTKTPIPSRLIIDSILRKEPFFERDLEPFLPDLSVWRSRVQRDEAYEVGYVRALLAMNEVSAPISQFRELLIQLALSLPRFSHSWLFDQLLLAIASHRIEFLYLRLYRLLEFFFPMKGLIGLRDRLKFEGSVLDLRSYCDTNLAWSVNHNTGLRTCVSFSSSAFAVTCHGKSEPPGDEQAITRFKEDAMAKIAELRHKIAHQNFEKPAFGTQEVHQKTEALLIFLAEAFPTYFKQAGLDSNLAVGAKKSRRRSLTVGLQSA